MFIMSCELEIPTINCACGAKLPEPIPGKTNICQKCGARWEKSNAGWSKGEIYKIQK
ncbi:MAG: hypothetical protein PHI66_03525 [Candidatus Pacebacteria bacterium]|nr:hypothetical protein [Candidatus Paceibacterota bacterium]